MTAERLADLELIRGAALIAGRQAVAARAAGLETTHKSDGSPVTNADLAVDQWLRARLSSARPDYGWLSEETADDPARLARERVFIVDPIDGTRAFIGGRPWWSVSIAVVEAGRPIVGVVHAPDRDETYEAAASLGARRGTARRSRPVPQHQLEDCAMLAEAGIFAHPAWPAPWPPPMRVERRNSVAYRLCSRRLRGIQRRPAGDVAQKRMGPGRRRPDRRRRGRLRGHRPPRPRPRLQSRHPQRAQPGLRPA